MKTETLEARAKRDMEQFLKDDPAPLDVESAEYYAWNRRRVARARAFIDAEAAKFVL